MKLDIIVKNRFFLCFGCVTASWPKSSFQANAYYKVLYIGFVDNVFITTAWLSCSVSCGNCRALG